MRALVEMQEARVQMVGAGGVIAARDRALHPLHEHARAAPDKAARLREGDQRQPLRPASTALAAA